MGISFPNFYFFHFFSSKRRSRVRFKGIWKVAKNAHTNGDILSPFLFFSYFFRQSSFKSAFFGERYMRWNCDFRGSGHFLKSRIPMGIFLPNFYFFHFSSSKRRSKLRFQGVRTFSKIAHTNGDVLSQFLFFSFFFIKTSKQGAILGDLESC